MQVGVSQGESAQHGSSEVSGVHPADPHSPTAALSEPRIGFANAELFNAQLEQLAPSELELLELALAARGHHVLDQAGSRIGKVISVLVDRESGKPQWLRVTVRGHRREAAVGMPISGLSNAGGMWWTPLEGDQVRNAPLVPPGLISGRIEQSLCRYFSLPPTRGAAQGRWERRATCGEAFRDPENPGVIGWIPAPRGAWR